MKMKMKMLKKIVRISANDGCKRGEGLDLNVILHRMD